MGAHSTMEITREDAKKALILKVLEADDQKLEAMMDAAFYDELYNFMMVTEYNDDVRISWHNGPLIYGRCHVDL